MRTGGWTVQQALSGDAAAVLRQALGLARRRGHAQVTPLHVGAALLSSTREGGGAALFRRACLRSHPLHRDSPHPLHCRALELCFTVALNRLPTIPPPSSDHPALSNALVAALKRAQAHQRRGGADQHNHHHQPAPPQSPPLLPVKVELEQLVISILDDPGVSRVMREAGFSSTCVKKAIEDRGAAHPSSTFFLDGHRRRPETIVNPSSFCPPSSPQEEEDVELLTEALLGRRNRKKSNAVVVGDSLSYCEGLVGGLMSRVRRGKVREELRLAQFVNFQLSPASSTLMNRGEAETTVSHLRTKVDAVLPWSGVVVIYVGDLRWAAGDETTVAEAEAADHLVAELARLVAELEARSRTRIWLVATANYQTYMRCKTRRPSFESQWAMQPVFVPSDGLALSLHAQSARDSRVSRDPLHPAEEQQRELICGDESSSGVEGEVSMFKLGRHGAAAPPLHLDSDEHEDSSSTLPFWLKSQRPGAHQEGAVAELRRRWTMMWCQNLDRDQNQPLFSPSLPWKNQNQSLSTVSSPSPFADSIAKPGGGSSSLLAQSVKGNGGCQAPVGLGFRTATDQFDLWQSLRESIPWQSETVRSVAEALLNQRLNGRKGAWLLVEGNDGVAKRRLPVAIAQSICGSADRLTQVNLGKPQISSHSEMIVEALRKDPGCVVSVEEIHRADADFLKFLAEMFENGGARGRCGRSVTSSQAIFVLATGSKRSAESDAPWQRRLKNQRISTRALDLNVSAEEEEEDAIAGDLGGDLWIPRGFLRSIAARVAMDARCPDLTREQPLLSDLNRPSSSFTSSL
ncbi:unnamed protein product [Spirodela intermedia]|uniref:Clp R domain-containing protein n=1 Tax=Spirodela intermedia TaxID=51605 RepID=A0A7I8LE05_SPIIN|nr:unnamed protein product [Spirodela intermedia]